MSQELLNKLKMPAFCSLPFISKGTRQTLAAFGLPCNHHLSDKKHQLLPLSDGDSIVLVENCPSNWENGQRIILMVHGLTGSHRSKYLIRVGHLLLKQEFLVVRVNLRGCGLGAGLAKHPYHSGRSEDIRSAVEWLSQRYPKSPITVLGFSLGANMVLKMAGEDGEKPTGNLDSIIAISPPLNLHESVKLIIDKKNRLFDQHFVKKLIQDIHRLHQFFPELPQLNLNGIRNIYEFDEVYTAPRSGFKSAVDYYTRCSSFQFIEKITIPTFILYANDDPVVHPQAFLDLPKKPNIDVLLTSQGGHMGWLGFTGKFGQYRWMDKIIVNWTKWAEYNFV